MKSIISVAVACAALWNSVGASPIANELHRRTVVPKAACAGPGKIVADPPGAAPRRSTQVVDATKGIQKTKLRYGPYLVPGMMKKSIMGEEGALWNCGDDHIEKPCEECTIVGMVAGLEYPNGTNGNIDTGMWMHHMVAVNSGPSRWDATCHADNFSLPHLVVGADPRYSERFFASGNERTIADLTQIKIGGKDIGYHIVPEDKFAFIVDMMNMNMDDRVMYLTITYDHIDGALPNGYRDVKPVWLDADQCALSEIEVTNNNPRNNYDSASWVPNFDGDIAVVFSHVHDGGVNVALYPDKAQTDMTCDMITKYSETKDYVFNPPPGMMAMDDGVAKNHISTMTNCTHDALPVTKLNTTQTWSVKGSYDYSRYPGNFADGEPQDVMVIAFMYVALPPGGAPRPQL